MSYATQFGKGVILGPRGGSPINRPQVGMPQAQPAAENVVGDLPEYIQLDEAGMAGEVVNLRNQIKQIQMGALSKGVDLNNPSTWVRPEDKRMAEVAMQSINQATIGMQRLKQGYDIQKYMMQQRAAGNVRFDDEMMQGAPTTFGDMRQESYSTNMPRVDRANRLLEEPVTSKQDYDRKMAFYNQSVNEIQREVASGMIAQEEAFEMISRLSKPGEYAMDPLQEAKIESEKALARQRRAAAAKSGRESILPKPVLDEAGGFLRLLDKTRAEEPVSVGSPYLPTVLDKGMSSSDLSGFELAGNKGYTSDQIIVNRGGTGTLLFRPDGGMTQEEVGKFDKDNKFAAGQVTRKKNGVVGINFSEDNLLPLFRSLMSDSDYGDFTQALLREKYLGDGKLNRKDYEDYIARNSGSTADPLGMRSGGGTDDIDL